MRYYIEHPAQAEAIIAHAHEYIAQFRDREREKLIALLVRGTISGEPGSADPGYFSFLSDSGLNFARLRGGF